MRKRSTSNSYLKAHPQMSAQDAREERLKSGQDSRPPNHGQDYMSDHKSRPVTVSNSFVADTAYTAFGNNEN